jgi:hypothetical protein
MSDESIIKVDKPLDGAEETKLKAGVPYHKAEGKLYLTDKFYDELVWEQIIVGADHQPIYRVWKYFKDAVPCFSCQKSIDMVFNIQNAGVFGRCLWCNVTFPIVPMDGETGDKIADLLSESVVSLEQAYAILKRTGQKPPVGLPALRQRNRRRH